MTARFDVVAYKNIGDKYPSVHLAIPKSRIKRLMKSLKELGYVQIVTTETIPEVESIVLTKGLGVSKR